MDFDFASAWQRLVDRTKAAGWEPLVAGSAAGVVLYPATLAAVQTIIFKPLRVGAHSRVVGTVFGLGSVVCAASVAAEGFFAAGRATSAGLKAHRGGAGTQDAIQEGLHHSLVARRSRSAADTAAAAAAAARQRRRHGSSASTSVTHSFYAAIAALGQDGTLEALQSATAEMAQRVLHSDRTAATALYGSSAAIWFLLCGARLRAVCPSNLMWPGAFARASIPARRHIHATPKEKGFNNAAGERFGCHTCGRNESGKHKGRYVADHQPPSKLAGTRPQVFLPHCFKCSSLQGGLVSRAKWPWWTARGMVTHGTSLRWYHLWNPIGIAAAVAIGVEPDPLK